MKIKQTLFLSLLVSQTIFASNTSDATNYLNSFRQSAGLIEVIADEELGKAAQNHSDYLNEEGIFSHQETNTNNSHYTGEWERDRLKHLNYNFTAINENISYGNANTKLAIDSLFQAIYHRLNFLAFNVNRLGAGVNGNYYTFDMAVKSPEWSDDIQNKNPKVVVWPPNNYTNAQPAFFNTEYPAPLPECKSGGSSSNPISIQFNPSKSSNIAYKSFSLKDEEGNTISTKEVRSDHLSDGQFVFISKDHRFDWNAKYSAVFNYSEDGKDKTISWSFKTKKLKYPVLKITSQDKTYDLAKNDKIALYFEPNDCTQNRNGISYDPTKIKIIGYEDKDTMYIEVIGDAGGDFEIKRSGEVYKFHIFTEEIESLSFSNKTANSVTLNWEHTSSGEETGYKIFRDGELIHTADINDRSYTDTNLVKNHTYKYTIKITNDAQKEYPRGEFGNIELTPNYVVPKDAYFIDIRNDWESEVYGASPKGSRLITYQFRQKHAKNESEDYSKRRINPNFVQEINDLVKGNKYAHIILICATSGRSGEYGDSSKDSAAKLLSNSGFRYVEHIMGGLFGDNGWLDNNLPVYKLSYEKGDGVLTEHLEYGKTLRWVNSTDDKCKVSRPTNRDADVYSDAINFCQTLSSQKYAGISNWRVPTIDESMHLMSHVDSDKILYPKSSPHCAYMATDTKDIFVYTTSSWNDPNNVGKSFKSSERNNKVAGIRCVSTQ